MATIAEVTAKLRADLKDQDPDDYRWTDDELDRHIQHALYDISQRRPYEQKTTLAAVDDSYEIDLSPLVGLINVFRVEFHVDRDPRTFRNFDVFGDSLTIDMNSVADVTESTLTGTVTFTDNSTSVTGSGTDFDGELEAGDYIKLSTDSIWYKIASITSDTVLTLEKAWQGATGADTVSVTPYREYNEVVHVYWEGLHTLNATSCSLPNFLVDLVIDGATAYAATAWANYAIDRTNLGASVDSEYLRWANNKLAKYFSDLRRLTKRRAYKSYSNEM